LGRLRSKGDPWGFPFLPLQQILNWCIWGGAPLQRCIWLLPVNPASAAEVTKNITSGAKARCKSCNQSCTPEKACSTHQPATLELLKLSKIHPPTLLRGVVRLCRRCRRLSAARRNRAAGPSATGPAKTQAMVTRCVAASKFLIVKLRSVKLFQIGNSQVSCRSSRCR